MIKEKRKRNQTVTNCPHTNQKHYAKGMCNNCYHKCGRVMRPLLCSHNDKFHYAKGYCQSCYHSRFIKRKKKSNDLNLNEDNSE